jgi:DNA-binding transcriptional LysR family regulator
MDSIHVMRVFVRVAQRESFAAAARDLRMSRASVTKHVAALEAKMGARLLDRTTRSVSVTEAGQLYLARCLECLMAYDDAEAAVAGLAGEPRGTLRVAAPFDFNLHMPRIVGAFVARHPTINVDVKLSNRTLDMVDEGIDVYLRVSNTLPSDAVARALARTRLSVWGTPAYFRKHGRPNTPQQLSQHRFALFDEPPLLDHWTFQRGTKRVPLKLRPAIVANSGEYLVAAVLEGACMGVLPSFLVSETLLRKGERVLSDWECGERLVSVVYPHRRFLPAKVKLFVEGLQRALGDPNDDPWWPRANDNRRPKASTHEIERELPLDEVRRVRRRFGSAGRDVADARESRAAANARSVTISSLRTPPPARIHAWTAASSARPAPRLRASGATHIE